MLTYQLENKNKYWSLYSRIRGDILSGKLRGGALFVLSEAAGKNFSKKFLHLGAGAVTGFVFSLCSALTCAAAVLYDIAERTNFLEKFFPAASDSTKSAFCGLHSTTELKKSTEAVRKDVTASTAANFPPLPKD